MPSPRRLAIPVAIVGAGCRFPGGVRDVESYWNLMSRGRCAIREIPHDRWSLAGFWDPQPDLPDRSYSKWGGFLDDIRGFDPAYFGLSPRDAEGMDPQQRLLLMVAVEAAQDAGIPLSRLRAHSTGVFVGVSNIDYGLLQRYRPGRGEMQAGTGTALSIVANRISNRLDLSGPSMCVDTACSSALVALDTACRHLADGSCDFAFAGGVNVLLDPRMFMTFSRAHMLSPTGRLRAFDAAADGFVRGEGAGLVLLRRLDDARIDGDDILAVVRSTAINQDGRTGTITEPSGEAQIAMLRTALESAEATASEIAYAEAHGTGTPVGDPIEARALGAVLGRDRGDAGALPIGSVKTNIGHLEPAAGIAGLIKAALVLKRGSVPPSLGYETVNPAIDLQALGLTVASEAKRLVRTQTAPCAIVNSFGFGGTNACAVLQAYESEECSKPASVAVAKQAHRSRDESSPIVVPLSGPTTGHVEAFAARLLRELDGGAWTWDQGIAELAAALGMQRDAQENRAAIVARNRRELRDRLEYLASGRDWPSTDRHAPPQLLRGRARSAPKVVFTMTGQGGQWWAMGRELLQTEPVFRRVLEEFDTFFSPVSGWSTLDELSADEQASRIDDAAITPAVMFAFQVGLAEIWRARGVTPDIVLGHSFGEVTAAYLAGGIGMAEVARLVKYRGLIRGAVDRRGAMAAIGLGAEAIAKHLPNDGSIEIGGYNSPSLVTVTGDENAIDALIARLNVEDPAIVTRKLALDFAYHSSWFAPVEQLFKADVGMLETAQPNIPVVSTVTGELNADFSADYWWRNLRYPVLYQKGIEAALALGGEVFIELGPHRTLSSMTAACAAGVGCEAVTITSLDKRWGDPMSIAVATAQSWVAGVDMNWSGTARGDRPLIRLPQQPWILRDVWSEPEETNRHMRPDRVHPLLGRRVDSPDVAWRSDVSLASHPWLADHRLDGACVMPAAAYIEMLSSAARVVLGKDSVELIDVSFPAALYLGNDDDVVLETRCDAARRRVEIQSRVRGSDDWELRASASVFAFEGLVGEVSAPECNKAQDVQSFYADAAACGYGWGRQFQGLKRIRTGENRARGDIEIGPLSAGGMALDPCVLDSALQLMLACDSSFARSGAAPASIARVVVCGELSNRCFATARVVSTPAGREVEAEISVGGSVGGRVLIERLRALPRRSGDVTLRGRREPSILVEEWREIDVAPLPNPQKVKQFILAHAEDPRALAVQRLLGKRGMKCSIEHPDAGTIDRIFGSDRVMLFVPECDGAAQITQFAVDAVRCIVELGVALGRASDNEVLPAVDLVTVRARALDGDRVDPTGVAQAAAIGAVRTLAMEKPSLATRSIDLGSNDQGDLEALADIMCCDSPERELVVRRGRIFRPRLVERREADLPPRRVLRSGMPIASNFALRQSGKVGVDGLTWMEGERTDAGAVEVTVRVRAVGLNFRDVMAVAGLLPADAEPVPAIETLGLELSGIVVARGRNVNDLDVGDRVFGMGSGALRRYVTWPATSLSRVPPGLGDVDLAAIPSAFLTAHYSLDDQARLKAGETVLIHSAAGGVGLAAIAIAKRTGARVIATAGTAEKRRFLETAGAALVLDSRSLAFADDVRRFTGGKGVDVVLNSLGGAFIEKSLACVAPYGRFIELGKRDVWSDGTLALKALRANISLHVVDLAALIRDRPDVARRMLQDIIGMWQRGEIGPLPSTVFGASRAREAFAHFAEAKHVGKIVVDMNDGDVIVARGREGGFKADAGGTYLVTGGTRGFGASVARWLVECGAGRVVTASRISGPSHHCDSIEHVKLDVCDRGAVDDLIAKLTNAKMPLKGIVHAAVVYDDAMLPEMTLARIERVISPKLQGGVNLTHAVERAGAKLDFFVSFSSLAQVVGWPGQSNYAAANCAIEALAHWQRARGIMGQCINWGALGESGHVARSGQMQGYLESAGWISMTDGQALKGLKQALRSDAVSITYAAADWSRLVQSYPALAASPRIAHLSASEGSPRGAGGLAGLTGERLRDAALRLVRDEAAKVLRTEAADLQGKSRLDEVGIDLLSSFELRNRIGQALGRDLPMSRYAAARTFDALASLVATLVSERGEGVE